MARSRSTARRSCPCRGAGRRSPLRSQPDAVPGHHIIALGNARAYQAAFRTAESRAARREVTVAAQDINSEVQAARSERLGVSVWILFAATFLCLASVLAVSLA